jgi:UDP-glucose:(heptosyl)LPS alpha-1,3-glucosyltransferase
MVRDDMIRYYKVPEDRIALVYNGVDCEQFSPAHRVICRRCIRENLKLAAGDLMLLTVAHNFRLKGVGQLITAVSRLPKELRDRCHVVVAGKGFHYPYTRLADQLGMARQIHFVGAVDVPQEYYSAADIYCQPTFYDPCSLTVLEALASGLPVITTRYNGACELMENGREGFILDHPDDMDAFANHLKTLADPALRMAMGEAARRTALEHTLEKNCKEMMIVFERAAAEKRGGPR